MISIGSVVRVAYDFQGEAENEELRSPGREIIIYNNTAFPLVDTI